jgi:hypothetical protein
MSDRDRLVITITGEEAVENVENALDAAASELDSELSSGRGRPSEGEISVGVAAEELATAYTGYDARDVDPEEHERVEAMVE